jgi:hypothetical protein
MRSSQEAIKIHVVSTDGVKVVNLHYDFREIPKGVTARKWAAFMLSEAMEKIQAGLQPR